MENDAKMQLTKYTVGYKVWNDDLCKFTIRETYVEALDVVDCWERCEDANIRPLYINVNGERI